MISESCKKNQFEINAPTIKKIHTKTHRESLLRVHLDHTLEQALAVGRNKVWDVKHPSFHLLEQLAKVVVVEGQGTDEQRVQDDPAGPHVGAPTVVLFALG